MFSLFDSHSDAQGSRRELLRVGGIALGGLTLPDLSAFQESRTQAAESSKSRAFGQARSVIVIFLGGGPPQHETWDPKPEAPAEIRGGFGTIASAVPGLHVGELMPMTARHTDKIAVLRAMVTNDNAHSSSGYQMLTGVPHIPLSVENAVSKAPNLAPHWGSVAVPEAAGARIVPPVDHTSQPHREHRRDRLAGTDGGVLGPQYDPWLLTCDPSQPEFNVPDLALPSDLSRGRLTERLSLLQEVDQRLANISDSPAVAGFSRHSQQALDLLGGGRARQAFDLSRESDATRDRYGRTRWAQSVLLARRLVEAGVSLVQVNWVTVPGEPNGGSWDTHDKHNDLLQRFLMPWMDQAYSALLTDLFERGLLDQTLVLWVGEFGHTPRFNPRAGRDHWGHCFSVALAGGGVSGGVVHGKSDAHAAFPVSGRVEPRDLHATVFHCLGYPPETELKDAEGRPLPLSRGRVIDEIL